MGGPCFSEHQILCDPITAFLVTSIFATWNFSLSLSLSLSPFAMVSNYDKSRSLAINFTLISHFVVITIPSPCSFVELLGVSLDVGFKETLIPISGVYWVLLVSVLCYVLVL